MSRDSFYAECRADIRSKDFDDLHILRTQHMAIIRILLDLISYHDTVKTSLHNKWSNLQLCVEFPLSVFYFASHSFSAAVHIMSVHWEHFIMSRTELIFQQERMLNLYASGNQTGKSGFPAALDIALITGNTISVILSKF